MIPQEASLERGRLELPDREVSTLLLQPPEPIALLVLGHGAGTDMEHEFMEGLAGALAEARVATLRYNFPFSERGSGPPDRTPVLVTTVDRVARRALELADGLPLFLGGKSMGGRMASHTAAQGRVAGSIHGLVFVGFPLHRPREPAIERAEHLGGVELPMLFVQGTRDPMADPDLVRGVLAALGARARVRWIADADHGFAVPKRSGMTPADVYRSIAEATADFIEGVLS